MKLRERERLFFMSLKIVMAIFQRRACFWDTLHIVNNTVSVIMITLYREHTHKWWDSCGQYITIGLRSKELLGTDQRSR